jgi:hypothetical protein
MKEQAPTVDLWARFPGVAGCQTKMLAGLNCGDLVPSGRGPALLAKAKALVRSPAFVFVGLVEEWEASICLLHATLGRGTRPVLGELQSLGHSSNSRTLRPRDGGAVPCRLLSAAGGCFDASSSVGRYNESVLGGWRDDLDEALYAAVVDVYLANLARHGLGGGAGTRDSTVGAPTTRRGVVARRRTPFRPREREDSMPGPRASGRPFAPDNPNTVSPA